MAEVVVDVDMLHPPEKKLLPHIRLSAVMSFDIVVLGLAVLSTSWSDGKMKKYIKKGGKRQSVDDPPSRNPL